jgi:hypothetical protein
MKISLLHPSRNRSEKAAKAIENWLQKSSKKIAIEYILSLDNDEVQLNNYLEWLQRLDGLYCNVSVKHIRGYSDFVVAATNRAARISTGDVLVFMADDFDCPVNWDEKIVEIITKNVDRRLELAYAINSLKEQIEARVIALLVEDGCNTNYNLLTLPIITKEFYLMNGYFFHPFFKSMWCDNFIFEQAKRGGYLIDCRKELTFVHKHFCNPNIEHKAELDETYIRSNNQYDEGKKVFDRLMIENGWN